MVDEIFRGETFRLSNIKRRSENSLIAMHRFVLKSLYSSLGEKASFRCA